MLQALRDEDKASQKRRRTIAPQKCVYLSGATSAECTWQATQRFMTAQEGEWTMTNNSGVPPSFAAIHDDDCLNHGVFLGGAVSDGKYCWTLVFSEIELLDFGVFRDCIY